MKKEIAVLAFLVALTVSVCVEAKTIQYYAEEDGTIDSGTADYCGKWNVFKMFKRSQEAGCVVEITGSAFSPKAEIAKNEVSWFSYHSSASDSNVFNTDDAIPHFMVDGATRPYRSYIRDLESFQGKGKIVVITSCNSISGVSSSVRDAHDKKVRKWAKFVRKLPLKVHAFRLAYGKNENGFMMFDMDTVHTYFRFCKYFPGVKSTIVFHNLPGLYTYDKKLENNFFKWSQGKSKHQIGMEISKRMLKDKKNYYVASIRYADATPFFKVEFCRSMMYDSFPAGDIEEARKCLRKSIDGSDFDGYIKCCLSAINTTELKKAFEKGLDEILRAIQGRLDIGVLEKEKNKKLPEELRSNEVESAHA